MPRVGREQSGINRQCAQGDSPRVHSMMSKKMTLYNDYTPDGRKLSSRHYGMVPKGNGSYRRLNTTDLYIDGLILRDGVPFMWQFDGGYVSLNANATPTSWNYYITDHLGSTRKVVDSNNNVKETINYYPFGSEMKMRDPAQMAGDTWQPYRFTGKELDKQNGLNWYDFGARQFDVAGVPMWTSVDPMAEKYYNVTPYNYCHNDPVNMMDPNGMDDHFDENGKFIERTNTGSEVMIKSGDDYKNITEVDFSNNKSAVESIGSHYLAKADKGEFNITASNTDGNIPQGAAFSNDSGSPNYNIYLTNGRVNQSLGNCYNFECVTYHESTHRYDSSTLGGTIGEVNAIIRTANECPAWNSASDEFIQSQASYAAKSLNDYGNFSNNDVQRLNKAFAEYATFELNNNKVSVSNHLKGIIVCGNQR